jgi:hypothetical protein
MIPGGQSLLFLESGSQGRGADTHIDKQIDVVHKIYIL